jgi:ribosomal-protein-alanine N-acetyltransferase
MIKVGSALSAYPDAPYAQCPFSQGQRMGSSAGNLNDAGPGHISFDAFPGKWIRYSHSRTPMEKHDAVKAEKWPSPQPVLQTERLRLRPLALSDAKEIQLLAGDFSIADTTLNVAHPYPDGLAEDWISTHPAEYEHERAVTFAVTLKPADTLIGVVGLGSTKRFRRAELGYWIAKRFWNQGYATEAAEAVIDFGFSKLALHKIEANHLIRNPSSGKVMRKLSFEQEGILRDHVIKWDRFEDVVTYGLICQRDLKEPSV